MKALVLALTLPGAALAQQADDLAARGFETLDCRFTEQCVIGAPCSATLRGARFHLHVESGKAYREETSGRMRSGRVSRDARWRELSDARSVTMPLREGVAGRLTMFHDGTAIWAETYAGDPPRGQFLRGSCGIRPDRAARHDGAALPFDAPRPVGEMPRAGGEE